MCRRNTVASVWTRRRVTAPSALARAQTVVFGAEPYPAIEEKAAALLHSITRNHALVDGNKRLGLATLIAFLGVNGRRLTLTNDEAYDVVIAVAAGELDSVPEIAEALRAATEPYETTT